MPPAADPDLIAGFAAHMARLGPFGADRAVAVAVSGGRDSLALAWLAARWGRPTGLIVDHGLRPASADEAALTAERLAGFGVPSHILTLRLPPGSNAQAARAARYQALTQACHQLGLPQLLLGHHAGDQAETILLRERHGSGPAGRAGMAAIRARDGVALLRPLLDIPRAALGGLLTAQRIVWVEDPSNANPAAERTRLRAELAEPDGQGPRTAALLARAAAASAGRADAESDAARWLAAHAVLHPALFALLPAGPWPEQALSNLLRWAGAGEFPPAPAAVAALAAAPRAATVAGARLVAWRGGWLLGREAAAMQPPIAATQGALWDRRFHLTEAAPGASFGALGDDAAQHRNRAWPPAAILATLPCLRWSDGAISVPHLALHAPGHPAIPPPQPCPPNPAAPIFTTPRRGGDARGAKSAYVRL